MSTNTYSQQDMLAQLALPNEQWNPVNGTNSRYLISNLGRLVSTDHRGSGKVQLMNPALDANGYLRTVIIKNGRYITVKMHRLVAEAFVQNFMNKPQVNHINHVRTDNRAENLEWVTHRENIDHMMKHGRQTFNNGEKNGMAKLTEEQVKEARSLYKPYVVMAKDLAKKYGVSTAQMKEVLQRKVWKHV